MRGQYDDWDYYEAYDDSKPHQHLDRPSRVNARPARKQSEREIPGTDAWIEAQAEKRKKIVGGKGQKEGTAAATPSRVPAVHQPAASPDDEEVVVGREEDLHEGRLEPSATPQPSPSYLYPEEDDPEERTTSVSEDTSDRRWIVVSNPAENMVAMRPPANPTIEDWRQLLDWEPEGTVLYDAIYVRELWLRMLASLPSEETQQETSCSLLVRLPTAEFKELQRAVQDKEAE